MKALLRLAAFIAMATVASARTEYIFHTGPCEGGGSYWSVTSYAGGVPIDVTGVDCFGHAYTKNICSFSTLASDPFGILTPPNVSGVCDDNSTWMARITYDQNYVVNGYIGRNCAGIFWQAGTCAPSAARQSNPLRGRQNDAPATPGGRRLE